MEKIPSKKTLFSSLECPYLGMLLGLSQQQKREKLEKEMKLNAHFFSNVITNYSLLCLYWPAPTNFVSNVARESKRVAYPCSRGSKNCHMNFFAFKICF